VFTDVIVNENPSA